MPKIKLKYIFISAILLWMFVATVMVIEKGLENVPEGMVWIQNIIFSIGWLVWAFFTPLVYSIYKRFSIISKSRGDFLLIHLGLSLLVAFVQLIISGFLKYLLWNLFVDDVTFSDVLLLLLEKFHIDLLVYWILIGAFSLVDWTGLNEMKTESSESQYLERLAVKATLKLLIIQVDEISCFEAYGDYVKVYSGDKFYLINDSMAELEKKLDPKKFTRIHRSTIINLSEVREIEPHINKEFYLTMKSGKKLKASRTYQENLRKFIDNSI
ncbi:MAG: LytTR family DNA-binding domain-containing protein [Cyclobacteriaceae bacterium]